MYFSMLLIALSENAWESTRRLRAWLVLLMLLCVLKVSLVGGNTE
jgi:hypothetical protein